MEAPTKAEVVAARKAASMTQAEAGALVYRSERGWQDWELGKRPVDLAAWELFLIKTKKARQKSGV